MHNMQVVMNSQKTINPIFNAGFVLKKDSYAYKIVDHLFDFGEKTGGQLIRQFDLKNSPMTYIRRYVDGDDGMIIAKRIDQRTHKYSINPRATKYDFGIAD